MLGVKRLEKKETKRRFYAITAIAILNGAAVCDETRILKLLGNVNGLKIKGNFKLATITFPVFRTGNECSRIRLVEGSKI